MKNLNSILKWLLGISISLSLFLVGLYAVLRVENRELNQETRKEANGEFMELPEGWVNFQLDGPDDAPLVVFVPGFSVPSYIWEPTTRSLQRAGYQTLSYDLYGRGYSDRPNLVYDLELFTTQLDQLLTMLNKEDPVFLVGLSMGGPIVSRFANQHPDRVNGVILIAPEVMQPTSQDIFPLNLPGLGDFLMVAVMEPVVLPKLQPGDFFHPDKFPGWEEKYQVQLEFQGTGRALLSTIRELVKMDPEAEYKTLRTTGLPVLLIWGKEDQTIGADQINVLQKILPDMEVFFVDDAGHIPHYERPEIVNPVMIEFLDRTLSQ
ncbi:MAG: alpha/beta hydrolase [Anaerolineales bacterium]|nr:alpha/beta hydrolase [Anaerolineales bacterium]